MEQNHTITDKDDHRICSLLFLKNHRYKLIFATLLSLILIIGSIIFSILFTRPSTTENVKLNNKQYNKNKNVIWPIEKHTSTSKTIPERNFTWNKNNQIFFSIVTNTNELLTTTSTSEVQTNTISIQNLPSNIISKSMPLLIMTFNIQFYKTSKTTKSIADFIISLKPDVVCLQENFYISDWNSTHLSPLNLSNDYFLAADCQAEEMRKELHLSNTIYVRKIHRNFTETLVDVNLQITAEKIRCAAVIRLYDTTIANLHLCGGRFDDKKFAQLQNHKHLQLERLIQTHNPDIIVGDFNNENSEDVIMKQLDNYPFYQKLSSSRKSQFVNYFTSGLRYLRDHTNYTPAYNETIIGKTSAYGGTPDWIYVKNRTRLTGQIKNHDVISKKLSDHNAVTVEYLFFPDMGK